MTVLTRRDRRALWIGALIVAPIMAWRGVIAPLAAIIAETRARAESAEGLLVRERALLRDAPQWSAQLAVARRGLHRAAPQLFIAADSLEASAAVAAWLRVAASRARLEDVRVSPVPSSFVAGDVFATEIDVTARGTTAALSRWLAAIESEAHFVSLVRVDIQIRDDGGLEIGARARAFARRGAP